jgi:hypothetical protein
MAQATEDRLDVFTRQLRLSINHDIPVADSTDEFYESTLAQVSAAYEALPVDHADGDDDSDLTILAVLGYQDDEPFTGRFSRDRAGRDPYVKLFSGAIIEFEIASGDSIGDFAFGENVYAVDNQTVSAAQGDGSGGSYARAGTIYEVLDDTVKVLVRGIIH